MPVEADPRKIERVGYAEDERRKSSAIRWWRAPRASDAEGPEDDGDDRTDPEALHTQVWAVAERMRENATRRRHENFIHQLMYSDVDPVAVYGDETLGSVGATGVGDGMVRRRTTLNVVQNAVDTAASLVAKNRPKPMFLTDGGDHKLRVRAEKLTDYVEGVFDDVDLYAKNEQVFTHGAIGGTGAIKFYNDVGRARVCAEVCFTSEILVDDVEGMREQPLQIHQRKSIAREELAELYPEHTEAICAANCDGELPGQQTVSDVIPVVESWHLRSGPKAKDGRHCICIETATLFDEPYEKDHYPIVFWRWMHAPLGFWGRGICQEIGGIQRKINRLLDTIDEAQELVGVPLLLVPRTANVSEDELLSNEMGRMVTYLGETPPQFATPPAMAGEIYSHLWALEQRAYNIVGINQSMAQGQKQPGLSSGAAIREATDIASGRFQVIGQRWERFHIACAEVIVDLSHDLAALTGELTVRVADGDSYHAIKWGDVDLDRDRFKISVFPVSQLPSTPQGRIQTLSEFVQMGRIPPEAMGELLDFPDLKATMGLETGTYDLTRQTIARIKETDRYSADMKPVPQMDLAQAKALAAKEYVLAKRQGIGDDVLALIALFAEDCETMLQQQQQAAAQAQARMAPPPGAPGPGGPPPGPGGSPPPGGPPGPNPNLGAPPRPPPSPMAAA